MAAFWVISALFLALWLYSAIQPREYPPEASAYLAPDLLQKAATRAKLSYLNSGLATVTSLAVLYAAARWSARSPIIAGRFTGVFGTGRAALLGICLGVLAAAIFALVSLPFDIYALNLNRSYGLTTMSLATYLGDWFKGFLLGAIQYAAEGAFIAWMALRFRGTWHLVLAGSFLVASICLTALYPVLIEPMFYKFRPLPEGPILQDVRELASKAGMRVDEVLVMEASAKTTAANAYFAGVGSTRRVVLYDTLLSSQSRENVRLVVAHELGHWRAGHILKSILLSSLGVAALLFLFRAIAPALRGDYLSLERFMVAIFVFSTVAGFALSPVSAYISRRHEIEADAYSLSLTGDNAAFIESQVLFAKTNLADVEPPAFIQWFAGTHPTTLARILKASKTQ